MRRCVHVCPARGRAVKEGRSAKQKAKGKEGNRVKRSERNSDRKENRERKTDRKEEKDHKGPIQHNNPVSLLSLCKRLLQSQPLVGRNNAFYFIYLGWDTALNIEDTQFECDSLSPCISLPPPLRRALTRVEKKKMLQMWAGRGEYRSLQTQATKRRGLQACYNKVGAHTHMCVCAHTLAHNQLHNIHHWDRCE